ncbi:MAG: condensation domain-containing protein, partial [Terriglobales bacterium]
QASEALPQGPAEELLAALWRELLGVPRVGRHDNFFELGGHSLLAMQLIARLRRVFGVELGVRALFAHPVLAEMAALVSGAPPADALVVTPRPERLPLSFGQERLWFLSALEGGASYTTVPLALRLRGALDAAALAQALGAIVERHEALRTLYPMVDGVAVQQVVDAGHLALTREAIGEGDVAARLEGLARHRFDLARDLPVKAALLRLGAEDHVLALVVHHIAFDGWSAGVLVGELAAQYRAALSGGAASLPALSLQYADWALWQRRRGLGDGLAYWRASLAGAPEVLSLPTARPREARRGRGAAMAVRLEGDLTQALRGLCRSEGVTLFMALYAALCVVLWRWSGERDLVVGTAAAGRERAEVEGLIGFFVNTLALRLKVDGAWSVRALLAAARRVALGAYAHQAVPFEQVVEALHPARRLDASPLFQVMLVLQGGAPALPSLAGLAVEGLSVPAVSAPFDLTLSLAEREDGIVGELVYDADLYDAATAARLMAAFAAVLQALVADAGAPLWRLGVLAAEERPRVLGAWNATARALPATSVVGLIAAQAAARPDATAVSLGDTGLSYCALHARADALARRLRGRGIGPERVVGLLLERSVELVVGVVAVLRAGGAFLPLDPGHPEARLRQVLDDAGAALVLTTRALSARLPAGVPALLLDGADAAAPTDDAPFPAPLADQLAYVIYTSGSTGAPKGVAVSARSLLNKVVSLGERFGVTPGFGYALLSSPVFDPAIEQMLVPL